MSAEIIATLVMGGVGLGVSQTRSGDGRIHQASIHSTVTQIGG